MTSQTLILNAGSSSLKWSVLDAASEAIITQGATSWTETAPGRHAAEIQAVLSGLPPVDAVGHRVVHGGTLFRAAVVVDAAVRAGIATLAELAPLHNPAALAGIDAVTALWPAVPQVAAFDTAFHATIPDAAALYPLPFDWTERWELRRYGFHGLSVAYARRRSTELLGTLPRRTIVCHLGAGCSVTALLDGHSVDTSMGFTPLDGIMMATRSGAVDPGLVLYLLHHQQIAVADLDAALNDRSGLLGVSGLSADFRAVLAAADQQARARLAYRMFVHSLTRMIGAMIAVLGGLDALVFTGGIGEHSAVVRADVAAALSFTGLTLDQQANTGRTADADVASGASMVRVLVLTAREDLTVLAAVRRLLGGALVDTGPHASTSPANPGY